MVLNFLGRSTTTKQGDKTAAVFKSEFLQVRLEKLNGTQPGIRDTSPQMKSDSSSTVFVCPSAQNSTISG